MRLLCIGANMDSRKFNSGSFSFEVTIPAINSCVRPNFGESGLDGICTGIQIGGSNFASVEIPCPFSAFEDSPLSFFWEAPETNRHMTRHFMHKQKSHIIINNGLCQGIEGVVTKNKTSRIIG